MNVADIGSAIATRFAAVVAPTNYTAIQKSTSQRQKGAGKLPMVVVTWMGTRDLEYGYGRRKGVADFSARFYYSQAADDAATDAALQAWHDKLVDALLGQIMLGEAATANGVTGAYVRAVIPGEAKLGEPNYAVLQVAVEVEFTHAVTFAA